MCYAIPARIISIRKPYAKVDYGGILKEVNISLLDNLNVGDYILIHAGFGIEKLKKKSALTSLKLIEEQMKQIK